MSEFIGDYHYPARCNDHGNCLFICTCKNRFIKTIKKFGCGWVVNFLTAIFVSVILARPVRNDIKSRHSQPRARFFCAHPPHNWSDEVGAALQRLNFCISQLVVQSNFSRGRLSPAMCSLYRNGPQQKHHNYGLIHNLVWYEYMSVRMYSLHQHTTDWLTNKSWHHQEVFSGGAQ